MDPITIFGVTSRVVEVLGWIQDDLSVIRDTYHEAGAALEYILSIHVPGGLEGDLGVALTTFRGSLADLGRMVDASGTIRARLSGLVLQTIGNASTGKGRLVAKAAKALRDQLRDQLRRHGIIVVDDIVLAVEQLHGQLSGLYLTLARIRGDDRGNFINEVCGSPQFRALDEYDKAMVEALLERYRESLTDEEEAKYFTSSVRLIDRLNLKLASSPQIRVNLTQDDTFGEKADDGLLGLISYRTMEHRNSGIKPAFETLGQRLFEEPRDDVHRRQTLPDWLASGSGLYLIQGNEGSGKSTTMKHIYRHSRVEDCLRKWAESSPLVKAAFYFWRSGNRLERSVEGLLRSLLHSVLSQQRRLIPIVFPMEWAALYAAASSGIRSSAPELRAWKVDELQCAFRKLLKQDRIPVKLFFLIDGIDEYQSEGGDEGAFTFIEFLKTTIELSLHAKALISSRPLEAFGNLGLQPQLKLDDLNRNDIASYVRKSLNSDEIFRAAKEVDTNAADAMVENLLRTSGGIFLWAVFCVNSIKADLAGGKTLAEVSEGFNNERQPVLQNLYQNIWDKMDGNVKRRASQIAQIMHARTDIVRTMTGIAEGDTRLVDLALALGDPWVATRSPIRPWPLSAVTIQVQCSRLAEEFTGTWPGFITIAKPREDLDPSSAIDYCHRSVPEFFRLRSGMLAAAAIQDEFRFCPRIALIKSAVQQLKFVPPTTPLRQLWALTTMALLAANSADANQDPAQGPDANQDPAQGPDANRGPAQGPHSAYRPLLEELDRTMQHCHDRLQRDSNGEYLETRIQDPDGIVGINDQGRNSKRIARIHWSNFHFDSACSHQRKWKDSFLSLAVQFGLQNYVKDTLENMAAGVKKTLRPRKGRPLLDYALVPSPVAPYDLVKSTLVKVLLDLGASPNDKFEKMTLWERALQWQYEAFVETHARVVRETGGTLDDARRAAEDRLETFRLLVGKGADVNASILDSRKQRITARKVLEESFVRWLPDGVLRDFLDVSFPTDVTVG
ncbi:hypothetical protein RB595_008811 [Gaeumannomyces hyphopodioides]